MAAAPPLTVLAPESAPRREPRLIAAGTTPLHRLDGELTVEVIDSVADLASRADDWDDLARAASEPNVFFERWFLAPALNAFPTGRPLAILLVHRGSRRKDVAPGLVGLFPCEQVRGRFGTRFLRTFGHDYCFLRSPLIRAGHEADVWRTVLDWADRSAFDVLDLPAIRGEGAQAQALVQALHERRALSLVSDMHVRALLPHDESAEAAIERALSSKQRHEYQRQFRRLGEQGAVEFRRLRDESEFSEWLEAFLCLEAQGWKGEAQTALSQSTWSRDFFQQAAGDAFARGQLQMLGLWCGGRPIAMKVNFLSGRGSFAFKIAYDESFARFSPGVQLELENIRLLHDAGLGWMDSCAAPEHPMINRLWAGRTIVQHLLVSLGSVRGNFAVGMRPVRRAWRRWRRPSAARPETHRVTASETSS
ncbi:MAG: GNAT family N-acetyltransferase [Planctomyces sp.]|nr:GNAT family N-acetyltransferase [Planctomyces sp.]